ncbi:MAG: hypothetical protein QM728_07535 [Gordonia sp. (in: high G+C Gram-positive bacteria)]|uniref:hypothetical protein n=1 Tax=Gordonia sp. (in: high G+C Gram-positive bacteria) TaxID=84139 RepID=UPI0039E2C002
MTHDDTTNVPATTDSGVPAPADDHGHVEKPKGKSFGELLSSAIKRALLALIGVALLIVLYFVLASVAPRWWADQVEGIVGKDSGLTKGVIYGLAIGVICTLVPIVCLAMAVASWDKLKHTIALVFLAIGVVTAVPNLLTLAVNRANPDKSASIRSAQTKLGDIIGFQGASLIGAIIGGVIGLIIVFFIIKYKIRGRKIREHEAHEAQAAS